MPQMRSLISSTNGRDELSIAVDFGGTKIAAARIEKSQVVERKQEATDQDAKPEAHLQTIVGLIEALSDGQDARLGVAVCGRVDRDGQWHALNNNTLRGLLSFPLRDRLEQHFGRPVTVMNDATAAAWGEFHVLAPEEKLDSLLYITVSTGVGGGLVLGGKPLQSVDGLASHLGFMSSPLGSEACGSGRFGTIESVASGTAIGRAASTAAGERTGFDVYQSHLAGDADATVIVNRSASAIAKIIADVRALLGIPLAAIGGSVGLADGYIDMVQEFLDEEPKLFRPQLMAARLGADSALFGITR